MARRQVAHEDLSRVERPAARSSDRSFGLLFAVVFAIVGLWPLTGDGPARAWALALGGGFAVVALLRPSLLRPLNRAWMELALLLHRVVNPVVMGLLFYLVITPFGVVMRMFGKDPLALRFDPAARSYWVERNPPGPERGTMPRQF